MAPIRGLGLFLRVWTRATNSPRLCPEHDLPDAQKIPSTDENPKGRTMLTANEAYKAINDLPEDVRDTLGRILMHLDAVDSRKIPRNRSPIERLIDEATGHDPNPKNSICVPENMNLEHVKALMEMKLVGPYEGPNGLEIGYEIPVHMAYCYWASENCEEEQG